MTETKPFEVGDRWIYTTPTGREFLHEVRALDVQPKYQYEDGLCVRLVAVDGGIEDTVTWQHLILGEDYWRPADA